jgi:hypothetical protein
MLYLLLLVRGSARAVMSLSLCVHGKIVDCTASLRGLVVWDIVDDFFWAVANGDGFFILTLFGFHHADHAHRAFST